MKKPKPTLKDLLLAPEPRTEALTPPRGTYRLRAPPTLDETSDPTESPNLPRKSRRSPLPASEAKRRDPG